ncbi:MAG TPA: IS1/IS6 family transposase [Nanoarchaeota archaeon]|nr:IS1/IS6 family transposase [Nanoarchaeota archaeon]
MEKAIKCQQCGKEHIKKDGLRKTGNRGLIQRYKCADCSHRFVLDEGFYRMRNSPQKITLCLDLFYRGVSTRKVQEHLQAFYPHNSDHSTILRWLWKYARQISGFTDSLKLNTGEEIQMDEVEYHRRKHHIRGGLDKNWLIDSIDPDTKFMVAAEFAKSRSADKIKRVMEQVKAKSDNVRMITTDGLQAYPRVIKRVFGYNNKLRQHNVLHNKVVVSDGGSFNYPIERMHNSIRARTKTMRGFHGSVESANLIIKGYEIYYNFITKHQSLNKCPYELATDLTLSSPNKWLELIQMSKGRI